MLDGAQTWCVGRDLCVSIACIPYVQVFQPVSYSPGHLHCKFDAFVDIV
jgi:hypothetical protein